VTTSPHVTVHYETARTVYFGSGILASTAEWLDDRFEAVYIITTQRLADQVAAIAADLGPRHASTHVGAQMHVPAATIAEALDEFDSSGARSLLSIGGGSTIGLAKALARRRGVPIAAAPTTYAGSEMTPVWGETLDGTKTTGRDEAVRPRCVIYDVALTESLSPAAAVASIFNALAHAMEALYAPDATPVTSALARASVHDLCGAAARISGAVAPAASNFPESAAEAALRGAWLAGHVLGATTMSIHHRLCHVLGGGYGLPHAETHATLLPYVLRWASPDQSAATTTFVEATGSADPSAWLQDVARSAGVPTTLRELGLPPRAVSDVIDLASASRQGHYSFSSSLVEHVVTDAFGSAEGA